MRTQVSQSAFNKSHFCDAPAKTGAPEVRGMQSQPEDMALTTSAGPSLLQSRSARESVATLTALLPVSRAQSTSSRASPQPAASSRASDHGSSLMSPASVARGLTLSSCAPEMSPSHSGRGLSGAVPSALLQPAAKPASILNPAGMATGRPGSLPNSVSLPAGKSVTPLNPTSTVRPLGVYSTREKGGGSCVVSPRPGASRPGGAGTQHTAIQGSTSVPLARSPTRSPTRPTSILPMRRSNGWSSPNDSATASLRDAASNGASIDVITSTSSGNCALSRGQRRIQEFTRKTIDV